LQADACGPGYSYDVNQRLLLESKEHMRARGIRSPDDWDAIALTFAEPVHVEVSGRDCSGARVAFDGVAAGSGWAPDGRPLYDRDVPKSRQDQTTSIQEADWEEVHKQPWRNTTATYDKERNNIDEAYEDLRFRRGTLRRSMGSEALRPQGSPLPCRQQAAAVHPPGNRRHAAQGRASRLSRSIAGRISRPRTFAAA
jgi:hypothetical protein